MNAKILSPLAGTGTEADPYRPQLIDEHAITNCNGFYGVRLDYVYCDVDVDTATRNAIAIDPDYVLLWDAELVGDAYAISLFGEPGAGMIAAVLAKLPGLAWSVGTYQVLLDSVKGYCET